MKIRNFLRNQVKKGFSVSKKDPFIELKDPRAFLSLHHQDFIIMHLP